MRIVHTLPASEDVYNGKVPDSLRSLASEGLERRYHGIAQEDAKAQLEWELQQVANNGRVSQYLMLRDVVMRANELGIPVSPGYGRMGNSVLAFAIGLCEPDPYAYGLVMPESSHIYSGAFGINVSADRAHELINYVKMAYVIDDGFRTLDLVELPAMDLMQSVAERAGVSGDHGFWASVPLDDLGTYKLLGDGDTHGVYQLDMDTVKTCLREWRPATFMDLLVLTTLNRYGDDSLIPEVIARTRSREAAAGPDKLLATLTAESYGFLIWQEQVIWALTELAGFEGNSGDLMRRTLAKKHPSQTGEARERFLSECASRKAVPTHRAQAIWEEIEKSSLYAVSKAHVVAHGLLTYRMAYLKAHWRNEFDAEMDDREQGRSAAARPAGSD